MLRLRILVLAFFIFGKHDLIAQSDTVVNLTAFAKEITVSKSQDARMMMVLWMPWQYWEAAMKQAYKGKPLDANTQEMISNMKMYNIICAVDLRVTPFGYDYRSEKSIRDSIMMITNNKDTLYPVNESTLNETMLGLLQILRPLMKSMLGQMGDNMNFYVFENRDAKGNRFIDAGNPGTFSVSWGYLTKFVWRLPLDILTAPKYCPQDGERHSGKFEYCPYHGIKLKHTK